MAPAPTGSCGAGAERLDDRVAHLAGRDGRAALGRQVGGGSGRDVATVAGVVGGALIGNAIQKNQAPPSVSQLYRVTVQQDNGGVRTFDYVEQPNVRVGDRVRIENDQLYR